MMARRNVRSRGRKGRKLRTIRTVAMPLKRNFAQMAGPSRAGPRMRMRGGMRGRGRPVGNRRRRVGKRGMASEIGFVNQRGGKKLSMTVNKLAQLACRRILFRFQGCNRMNATSGAVIDTLGGTTLATPGFFKLDLSTNKVGDQRFPLHVYNLTGTHNTTTNEPVLYTIQFTDLGVPSWVALSGQNSASGATTVWQYEDDNSAQTIVGNGFQQRFIQTDWYDIRLAAYGCRQQPTFYDIMVVSFTDENLHPCGLSATASLNTSKQYYSLWQGLVKNICYNTILPGAPQAFKGMVVKKRFRFVLQPSGVDEADRNPALRIVKFFYKDYRIRDYGPGRNYQTDDANLNSAQWAPQNNSTSALSHDPRPDQRLFLIVRASNTTPTEAGDADDTPSYDVCIRKVCRSQGKDT